MSVDSLAFHLLLKRGDAFTLDVAGEFPLTGITAVIGASGGGKTTLLRSLAGLERTNKSRIAFRGEDWDGPSVRLTPEDRRIGFVFVGIVNLLERSELRMQAKKTIQIDRSLLRIDL